MSFKSDYATNNVLVEIDVVIAFDTESVSATMNSLTDSIPDTVVSNPTDKSSNKMSLPPTLSVGAL